MRRRPPGPTLTDTLFPDTTLFRSASFLPQLAQQAEQIVRRDVMPGFVAAELIVWLSEHKIIRPGHTTLQELVSEALSTERRRLGGLLAEVLDESAKPVRQADRQRDHLLQLGDPFPAADEVRGDRKRVV